MGKLTKTSIDALTIPEKGQAFLWDSELRGFGVRVIPSGLKAFVLQYRNEEGRSRRIVIGWYGVLTVEQARKQAIVSSRRSLGALTRLRSARNRAPPSRSGKSAPGILRTPKPGQSLGASIGRSKLRPSQWIAAGLRRTSFR